ncbi:MAG: hypothetical protein MJK18_13835, partial [Bdellovibrionales bacterium]|nr:hypothetical protein [Bdellovibrionales bacterium]
MLRLMVGFIVSFSLFSAHAEDVNSFEGIDFSSREVDSVLIQIDTRSWDEGGQRLRISTFLRDEATLQMVIPASTGREGRSTPKFMGQPERIYDVYRSIRYRPLQFNDAIRFNNIFLLRAANLSGATQIGDFVLGGPFIPVDDFADNTPYIGLDWLIL